MTIKICNDLFINGTNLSYKSFMYSNELHVGGGSSGPSWQDIVLSGNGSLSLTNAKAHGLNYLKLYGGCEQRNLPVGYTQYEYLRSSGTQYIDLGYKGKGNTKVEIKFRYYQTSNASGSGRVFGSRQSSTNNAFAVGTSSGVVASTGNKVFWCYDGQSFYVSDNTFALDEWQTVIFSATEHKINGITEGDDYTVTTFETPSNLMLFAFDNNGTIGCGYVDIAYCKLWDDDGTLVRDLVSAGDGTTYSMFDKISNDLMPNAGTGSFEVGNIVSSPTPDIPIDIICNNGTIKYNDLMQIYIDGTVETVKDSLNNSAIAEMLLSVGDVKDVQSVLDGVITRNIGILILDGTESWQVATGTGYKQFYSTNTQGVIANSVSLMSTIAPYGCTASTRANYDFGCYSGGNGNLCFQMVGSSTINTTTDWTNYLSEQYQNNTPVIVIYPKLTATTESVTGQTLTTQSGSNTITITQASINNLPLEVSYKGTV